MNCVRCKKQINPNITVCPYCGAKQGQQGQNRGQQGQNRGQQGQNRGRQGQNRRQQGQNRSSKRQPQGKYGKKLAIILTAVLCGCAFLAIVLILVLGGRAKGSSGGSGGKGGLFGTTATTEEEVEEETVDAGTYYQGIGDVISITKADESKKVPTEGDVKKTLTERGFDQYEITTAYTISGEYLNDETIGDAKTKHPMYETCFRSESGMFWTVEVIDGSVFAYPASYNLDSGMDVLAIVSEKDSIIGYDSETNQFYEYVPKKTVAAVIKVEKIDAEHLNQLTAEEIDKYVK